MAEPPDLISKLLTNGESDPGSARDVILKVQEAFRKGDYAGMSALYQDDVDWIFHGPTSIFPDVGHRRGKVEVFKTFKALNEMYRFERHDSEQLIAEGNWAASLADVKMIQRSSGRVIQCKIASFHRVRDGKIAEYRGFTDSFDAVEQVLGREILN